MMMMNREEMLMWLEVAEVDAQLDFIERLIDAQFDIDEVLDSYIADEFDEAEKYWDVGE